MAGALDTVGSTIVNGASGALSWVENALGLPGADIMNAIKTIGGALNPFSWFSGFSSQVAQIIESVVIGVVAFVLVFAIVFFLHRRRRSTALGSGAESAGGTATGTPGGMEPGGSVFGDGPVEQPGEAHARWRMGRYPRPVLPSW